MHFVLLILLKFRVHPKDGLVLLSGGLDYMVNGGAQPYNPGNPADPAV
eukprot:COSAG02_NODE_74111_length_162_cov_234.492063_1_plen_47_part_01